MVTCTSGISAVTTKRREEETTRGERNAVLASAGRLSGNKHFVNKPKWDAAEQTRTDRGANTFGRVTG